MEKRLYLPHKKERRREKEENYRITLIDTGYKIPKMILKGKLRKEVEWHRIQRETQAGFRKRRNGIDNVYSLAENGINE